MDKETAEKLVKNNGSSLLYTKSIIALRLWLSLELFEAEDMEMKVRTNAAKTILELAPYAPQLGLSSATSSGIIWAAKRAHWWLATPKAPLLPFDAANNLFWLFLESHETVNKPITHKLHQHLYKRFPQEMREEDNDDESSWLPLACGGGISDDSDE